MSHIDRCIKRQDKWHALVARYDASWPNHCTKCQGWGFYHTTDEYPNGAPCEVCLGEARCPRCEQPLACHADAHFVSCSTCTFTMNFYDYTENSLGRPQKPPCVCHDQQSEEDNLAVAKDLIDHSPARILPDMFRKALMGIASAEETDFSNPKDTLFAIDTLSAVYHHLDYVAASALIPKNADFDAFDVEEHVDRLRALVETILVIYRRAHDLTNQISVVADIAEKNSKESEEKEDE